MLQGAVSGAVFAWLSFALIPSRSEAAPIPAAPAASPFATRYAAANAAILLIAVTACLTLDGLSSALVIPVTVASLLLQLNASTNMRAALGLAIVNLFGGLIASVAFAVLEVRPTLPWLFAIVLVVAMFFGGRAALRDTTAKIYAGALTTFLIVFGLGVSPIPGSAAETFSTRIIYVSGAIGYTLLMVALLWPRSQQAPQPES
jgi:hypothetical protein